MLDGENSVRKNCMRYIVELDMRGGDVMELKYFLMLVLVLLTVHLKYMVWK